MSTNKNTRFKVPVFIFGDGILGTLIAMEFSKNGIDVVISGSNSNELHNAASLRNQGTLQSGILQAMTYTPKSLNKNGTHLLHLKRAREKFESLAKWEDCIHSEDGVHHVVRSKDQLKEYQALVRMLGYQSKYTKPIGQLRDQLGYFGGKKFQIPAYFNLPDKPMDLDRIILLLKSRSILDSIKDPKLGKIFYLPKSDRTIKVQEEKKAYVISGFAKFKFESDFLIIAAGINSQSILKGINPGYQQKATTRGICLAKTDEGTSFQLKQPFFSRNDVEEKNFIFITRHGNHNIHYFDKLVISNGESFPVDLTEGNSYADLRKNYKEQVIEQHQRIKAILQHNLDEDELPDLEFIFCVLSSDKTKYKELIEQVADTNIIVAHPGLATASLSVAEQVWKKYKGFKTSIQFKKMAPKERIELGEFLDEYLDQLSKKIDNAVLDDDEKSWFRDP